MLIYKGLFYFISGLAAYVILLLVLRLTSSRNKSEESGNEYISDWHSKEELTIVDIVDETHDIKTFRFKRSNGYDFSMFLAGQFLSFQIKADSKLLRSYSISGSCENKSTLQVSIKKLKDGLGSSWFHSLNIGGKVFAFPPGGLFSDDALDVNSERIYVAGGIGITPLLCMIKTSIDRSNKPQMSLFYGMNSIKDMAFHTELMELADRYDNFSYFPMLSNKDPKWDGETGYISYDFIKRSINLTEQANFYFCGPPVMTDTISKAIKETGHNIELIHSEKFASPVAFDPNNIKARKALINIDNREFSYNGKLSLLEFFEANNLEVSFACRSGVCGACKCKLISGEIDAFTDSGLTSSEIEEGYILSCVSRPETDIVVKI